jgi:hypothetical protein
MPTVSKSFTPSDIFSGPADIYLGVQAPASAVPPVQGTNTLTLDGSGQPPDAGSAGIHLGLSEGPVSANTAPSFELIKADQFSAPVDAAFISSKSEIDFTVKELVFSKLQKFFAGLTSATYSNLGAGSTNPAADMLQIGSANSSAANKTTLLLIAPRRDVASKWMYVLGYKCYLGSAIAIPIQRKKETLIKLKFKCLVDTSRVAKDQTMQIVKMV